MDPHLFFDILSLLGIFAASWVGLALKGVLSKMENNQAVVKADLLASQNEMKEDLTAKHSENRRDLAVHQARDEEQFRSISRTLDRVEATQTRIEQKIDSNGGKR